MMEKRKQYVAKFRAQLDKTDARIRELQAKLDGYSAEKRKAYQDRIMDLKDRRAELRRRVDELQESRRENYARLRGETERRWNQLLSRVEDLTKKLRTK